jgi:hypothetical protein
LQHPDLLAIEQAVCGCAYGGTSWTTREEAERIAQMLRRVRVRSPESWANRNSPTRSPAGAAPRRRSTKGFYAAS